MLCIFSQFIWIILAFVNKEHSTIFLGIFEARCLFGERNQVQSELQIFQGICPLEYPAPELWYLLLFHTYSRSQVASLEKRLTLHNHTYFLQYYTWPFLSFDNLYCYLIFLIKVPKTTRIELEEEKCK